MDELTPIFRIEHFLDEIVNGTVCPYSPEYRVEFFLAKIAGHDVETPEPIFRIEKYLAYLCGEEVELPEPIFRVEFYLAAICGMSVEVPEPVFRVEFWLYAWSGGGDPLITLSGSIVRFTSKASKPMVEIVGQIEPVQDLHGYDNPWPAGGGKNILKPTATTTTDNDVKFTVNSDGTVVANGTASANALLVIGEFNVVSGETYTYSGLPSEGSNTTYSIQIMRGSTAIETNNATYKNYTATATETLGIRLVVRSGYTANNLLFSPMVRVRNNGNSTFASYSNICPITGWTGANMYDEAEYDPTATPKLTVTWQSEAGTVYGGTLTVTEDGSVKLRATHVNVPMSSFTWAKSSSGNRYYTSSWNENPAYNSNKPFLEMRCSNYKFDGHNNGSAYYGNNGTFRYYHTSNATLNEFYVTDDACTDLTAFNTAIANATIWYPIKYPNTYDLADVTILSTLLGENNVWTDTGDISVTAYGTEIVEPQLNSLQSLNLLLGNDYVNNHTQDDVSDDEALDIILGGNER